MRAVLVGLGLGVLALAPIARADGGRARPRALEQAHPSTSTAARAGDRGDGDEARECRPRKRRVRTVLDGKANLNTASLELLERLPGVGRTSAERIVERRARRPFRRIEELVRVKGFSRRRFQRIRPYLSVDGPSTLRPVWVVPRDGASAQEGDDPAARDDPRAGSDPAPAQSAVRTAAR